MGLARERRMTGTDFKTVLSRLALGERLNEAESPAGIKPISYQAPLFGLSGLWYAWQIGFN